jgi:hypothetical protein
MMRKLMSIGQFLLSVLASLLANRLDHLIGSLGH